MNVCLKTDIEMQVKGGVIRFKAGEMIRVDINDLIAYHAPTDSYFDISPKEFVHLN